MKRMHWAISLLLAGTAMQAQARERSLQDIAVPVSVLGTETLEQNIDRLEDINRVCAINRGHPAFGRNATPGVVEDFDIRGIKTEYGGRYGFTLGGFRGSETVPVSPDGRTYLPSELQRIELLQSPQGLNCEAYGAEAYGAENITPGTSNSPVGAVSGDPDLAVQSLPPEVQFARSVPTAAQIRAELDSLVQLCLTGADDETNAAREERYRQLFDQLREFGAIRDVLRERLLQNDPELDKADALEQLKQLDPAIDGAVFPSQLKCPPTQQELAQSSADPWVFYSDYFIDPASVYLSEEFDRMMEYAQMRDSVQRVSDRLRLATPTAATQTNPDQGAPTTDGFGTYGSAGLSWGQINFGNENTGIGFQSTGPGSETFAGTAPEQFDSFGGSVGATFDVADHIIGSVHYGYSEGDARSDFDIPAGGAIDVGNVYGELSPSGSTGLNIGNRGLTGFNEADFKIHEIKFSASSPLATEGPFTSTATLFINALFMDRNYRSETNATVFGTPISQRRDQDVEDRLFGLGGILNGRLRITDDVAATGSLIGGVYYRDSDMAATETNVCGLCPPADQNFTLNFDESDSGVEFAGSVSAGLEFDASPFLKFLVGAEASHLSGVGEIINPSSGDQVLAGETTRLGTTSGWRWRGFFSARLRF